MDSDPRSARRGRAWLGVGEIDQQEISEEVRQIKKMKSEIYYISDII